MRAFLEGDAPEGEHRCGASGVVGPCSRSSGSSGFPDCVVSVQLSYDNYETSLVYDAMDQLKVDLISLDYLECWIVMRAIHYPADKIGKYLGTLHWPARVYLVLMSF